MAAIYHPNYVQEPWPESFLMIGLGIIGTFMNTFGAKRLPILEGIVLVVHIFGTLAKSEYSYKRANSVPRFLCDYCASLGARPEG